MNLLYKLLMLLLLWGTPLQSFSQQSPILVKNLPFNSTLESTKSVSIVVFIGPDCPISQKYVHTLKQLVTEFPNANYFGVIPNAFTMEEVNEFQLDYEIPFELYWDRKNEIARLFGASITPEVFVFDSKGTIYYSGAIDNWFYELGKNRTKATQNYLKDALREIRNKQKVSIPNTKAIGCLIELK